MEEILNEEEYETLIDEGICPICGSDLKIWIDKVPYGDSTTDLRTVYCPNYCI